MTFLLFGGPLRASHHFQDVCWQALLLAEVVVAQPTFLCLSEVPGNCYDRTLIHVPGVAWVFERAAHSSVLLSFASKIHADLLFHVSWEDVPLTDIGVYEVEHSHGLFVLSTSFDYL